MQSSNTRTVRIFRYDPEKGGEGSFLSYSLDIPDPDTTTILDVLLRIQKEQDPSIAFRFACRVNMCGSCGMVINGREGLACKTNVCDLPAGQDITLRPLNHFPVIKDLVVDMGPFFAKYEDALPFFEPKEKRDEPYVIRPDDQKRVDIGMATDCIACGCCVSSCTMVDNHEGYCGPAALNRAFTLLADERDALFEARLTKALDSCYNCRTEFNCTEVCPKSISGTRAIKYIQRLALKNLKSVKPLPPHPAELAEKKEPAREAQAVDSCACQAHDASRRSFLKGAGGLVGAGIVASLGTVLGVSAVGPTLGDQPSQWVEAGAEKDFPVGGITSVTLHYKRTQAFHSEEKEVPVLVRRDSEQDFICFSSSCPHLGCAVSWDELSRRFKCACHGGAFDRDGKVIAGPPPSPLPRLPWKLENGILKVEVV
ncbi:2Fe-2S iron-sulfur cluster-binding protein [Desulfovibrio sp. SGI.169]|uniref:2Fe-2S iron-sulfur cluster-binding protein n=1 Tax=Desulfovibrio sp. SGI.169 TaxID=3420561 RepID=UPI003D050495